MDSPRFEEIEGHRPYLVRFALAKLRDAHLAEEAVQECLLAALENAATFRGGSSLRTWLTSILRFKVIDLQRKAVSERERFVEPKGGEDFDGEAWLDALFDETGHWKEKPASWENPEAALEQKRFWAAFESCLDKLPGAAGRVFFKREVLGEDTEAICKAESISPSNCWVILHRARIGLRSCLERNWFGLQGKPAGG